MLLDGQVELFAGNGTKGRADGPRLEASLCYPNDVKLNADHSCLYFNDVADVTSDGMKLGPTAVRSISLAE